MMKIDKRKYADMYGPTVGDRVRLGDTSLIAEVERDYAVYGEEAKFGGGKSLRDGMGQSCTVPDEECPDFIITSALIMDYTGIYKADVGIKNGRISAIGKAGNPDIMDGVPPGLTFGASTEAIAGEGLILTAGGIDTHIHFISPTQIETALYSGITTMIGGGTGPADGTNATTCTPGSFSIEKMIEAAEEYPMNLGFLGKGNSSDPGTLTEQIEAGACGLKIHEDWGATPAVIRAALDAADACDVHVSIHTDTLNEGGFVEDTLRAVGAEPVQGLCTYCYSLLSAAVNHAVKLVPLRQMDGQQALRSALPQIPAAVGTAMQCGIAELGVSGFGTELRSMQHETLYTRIYIS